MTTTTNDPLDQVLHARSELLKLRGMFNRYLAGITNKDYRKSSEALLGFEDSFHALSRALSCIEAQVERTDRQETERGSK
jgi:hypothetical protein